MNTSTTNPSELFGYDVIDSAGNKIGSVDNVWVDDATNELEFIGVKTGWLMGKTHVIPTQTAQVDSGGRAISVPYPHDQVKDAPSFSGDAELSPDDENNVYSYYGLDRSTAPSPSGLAAGESGQTTGYDTGRTGYDAGTRGYDTGATDQQSVTLSEEQLKVGKREVEAGNVRLRKVVHTERQEIPVDLRREEVQVERVPASGTVPGDAFQETEVNVPVSREEAVAQKEAYATEEVRVGKDVQTETQTVGADLRKEDVEVEHNVDTTGTTGERRW